MQFGRGQKDSYFVRPKSASSPTSYRTSTSGKRVRPRRIKVRKDVVAVRTFHIDALERPVTTRTDDDVVLHAIDEIVQEPQQERKNKP